MVCLSPNIAKQGLSASEPITAFVSLIFDGWYSSPLSIGPELTYYVDPVVNLLPDGVEVSRGGSLTIEVWNRRCFLGLPLGKALMAACIICQCVCVCQTCSTHFLCCTYLFIAKTDLCCMLMPYNMGNIMREGVLGSKVINWVLLDETLRYIIILKFV